MTYMKALSGLVLGCAMVVVPQAFANSIPVFATGVDNSGAALTAGTADSHYTLISPGGFTATAVINNDAWIPDSPTSSWISPGGTNGNNDFWPSTAPYDYQTTFDLTGYLPGTADLKGAWTSDNDSTLYLNGVAIAGVGFPGYAPGTLINFDLTTGFNQGLNTLDFIVNNGFDQGFTSPNPTGLLVSNLALTASTPEPSSLALLGTGLIGACGALRRRIVRS